MNREPRTANCSGQYAGGPSATAARRFSDGPAAFTLTPRPANLQVHVPLHAEGELHYWIANGVPGTAMPAWAKREPAPLGDTEIWQVVRYLEALTSGRVPQ